MAHDPKPTVGFQDRRTRCAFAPPCLAPQDLKPDQLKLII